MKKCYIPCDAFYIGSLASPRKKKKNSFNGKPHLKKKRSIIWNKTDLHLTVCIAQSAGAVEYTECFSADVKLNCLK